MLCDKKYLLEASFSFKERSQLTDTSTGRFFEGELTDRDLRTEVIIREAVLAERGAWSDVGEEEDDECIF